MTIKGKLIETDNEAEYNKLITELFERENTKKAPEVPKKAIRHRDPDTDPEDTSDFIEGPMKSLGPD